MLFPYFLDYLYVSPLFTPTDDRPPTLYSILESIVNYDKAEDERTKIRNLAKIGRTKIFDFGYPLSDNISKEKFEIMILNHFIMRRIGFETFTAFQIALEIKLNEIMPLFNKMFDKFDSWDIFEGESEERKTIDNRTYNEQNTRHDLSSNENEMHNDSTTTNTATKDNRKSDTPQNKISQIKSGEYVSEYEYDEDTNNSADSSVSRGTSAGELNTTEHKEGADDNIERSTVTRNERGLYRIDIIEKYQNEVKSIFSMIYKELDSLFYQLI